MKILNSRIAYEQLRRLMISDVEEFWVMGLRPDKTPINTQCIFRGTVDACLVHPRDIFRFACMCNASSLIIAHNHPSQDPYPSTEDIRFTRQLVKAGQLMQIPIIDHIIVTETRYCSFADLGIIK